MCIAPEIRRLPLFRFAGAALGAFALAACNEGETPPSAGGSGVSAPAPVASPGAPPAPPAPPVNAGGSSIDFPANDDDAVQFLVQSTFGPTDSDIAAIKNLGYSAWLKQEANASPSNYGARVAARLTLGLSSNLTQDAASDFFWDAAVKGRDQLRQRMMYALSQIVVVGDGPGSPVQGEPELIAYYLDALSQNALGNYRDLLEDITYSPAMGLWLTYLGNEKANAATGSVPDENYAREIMQLFTIGLLELNLDGTPVPGDIETYTNEDVIGLSRVFTGLGYKGNRKNIHNAAPDARYSAMQIYPEFHSPEEKTFLGETIPANTPAAESIDRALDILFNHPNVGPFIGRQLIQRLVASNPSPAYVARVAAAFNAGSYRLPDGSSIGSGRRGDLLATAAAVLLDTEARQDPASAAADFGKVREPVLRFTHWARAFDVRNARAYEETWLSDTSLAERLGQHPFRSPSVFNFYRPGFVAPGTVTGAAGVTAPELQIENEASVVGYANFMSHFVRDDSPGRKDTNGEAFSPNYADEIALADNVDALIDRLDTLLTYGRLAESTRLRIKSVLEAMTIREGREADDRLARVEMAVQLVVTSAEYLVQQ